MLYTTEATSTLTSVGLIGANCMPYSARVTASGDRQFDTGEKERDIEKQREGSGTIRTKIENERQRRTRQGTTLVSKTEQNIEIVWQFGNLAMRRREYQRTLLYCPVSTLVRTLVRTVAPTTVYDTMYYDVLHIAGCTANEKSLHDLVICRRECLVSEQRSCLRSQT